MEVILDVGANEGQTAAIYREDFPRATIYCFEPYKPSADHIRRAFEDDPLVHVVENAVAARSGTARLFLNAHSDMNSLMSGPLSHEGGYGKGRLVGSDEVGTISLDEFARSTDLASVDILKLDVEGAELLVLEGARKAFARRLFRLVYVEVGFVARWTGAPLFREVWNFIHQYDYTLFGLYNLHHARDGQLRRADALFAREDVLANGRQR